MGGRGDYSRDRVGGVGGDTSLPVGAGNLAVNMRQLAQSSLTHSSSNPQHPKVSDAAVIGVLNEEGEEIPKGFVVLRQPVAPEEIMAFVAERVAPHKKIRRLDIVDEIPKSASGKILRRVLRDREKSARDRLSR